MPSDQRCQYCSQPVSQAGEVCMSCVAKLKENRSRKLKELLESRASYTSNDIAHILKTNWQYVAIGLVAFYLLLGSWGVFGWGKMPDVQLTSAGRDSSYDPCKHTKQCLVTYMTPWCPSCQSAVSFVNAINQRYVGSKELGVKVVLGMDSQDALERMATKIGPAVFYDSSGDFASKMGVRGVPTSFLIASDGEIIKKKVPSALSSTDGVDSAIDYYVKNILGIG